MIFYKLRLSYTGSPDKIFKFPEGKKFKNFKDYFEQNKNIIVVRGFNKKNNNIYSEWYDGEFEIIFWNSKNQVIFIKYANGVINFPKGKEIYDRYINKFKKEKLEKILRSK